MATVTNNVEQLGRSYVARHTAVFSDSVQETDVKKISLVCNSVSVLNWSINSAGYVSLSWEGTPNSVFAVISGNGRWELGKGQFKKPSTGTGNILLTTSGFVSGDSYTLVLQGNMV